MINYLIYDCEIWRAIPVKGKARLNGVEYCQGWHDHENMGISVIGFLRRDDEDPIVASPNLVNGKSHLQDPVEIVTAASFFEDHPFLIGFNSASFDDNLCNAHGFSVTTRYDLLQQIRIAAFGSHRWQDQPKGFSYKLDDLAKANGLPPKTGHGELAPILWQKGKHHEVVEYCAHDVELTRQILELGLEGKLIDPNTEQRLQIPPLEDFAVN